MNNFFSGLFKYLLLLMLALTLQVSATSPNASGSVRLSGHVPHKAVANSSFLGSLEATTHVPVTFTLPLRNKAELEDLIQRLYNPADSMYGKYISTEEFTERFAPSQEDYDKVIAYAHSLGLTVKHKHPNRILLSVSGNAASIESAFNLRLEHFQLPNGRKFYAPNNEPQVPTSIASVIGGIVGLDNHAQWKPHNRVRPDIEKKVGDSAHASFSGPSGGLAPADIATAYDFQNIPADGTGQVIALFQLASFSQDDINTYCSYFGLPQAQITTVQVDGGSGQGPDSEVTLDIELSHALAPQSQIYIYEGQNSGQGVLDTYNKIATDNIAKQVSTSWGLAEDNTGDQILQGQNSIFQQMASQGQTIYAAAGDDGAYDHGKNDPTTLVVDAPACQPYVVGVGGTSLTVDSSGAYSSESVWNNDADHGNGGGGGGVSNVWPIPSWQANVPTVSSTSNRNVPDVSLDGDPYTGYSIYFNGQWTVIGGTSCAAPIWAAFTALVNQARTANQQPTLGFANPTFYAIGQSSAYSSAFHDITDGNNKYYNAGPGYDNATGWGSFDAANLFNNLVNSAQ